MNAATAIARPFAHAVVPDQPQEGHLLPHPAEAWYAYAVILADSATPKAAALLPGTRIEALRFHPLTVLVSRVPRALFDRASPAARTADPDWMAERVAAHHGVIAAAAETGPCLPMAFGTLFTSPHVLIGWLAPRVDMLQAALDQVASQTEWVIALREDPDALAEWLDRNDPALVQLAAAMAAATPGTAFLMARRLDKARAAARSGQIAAAARAIADALAGAGLRTLDDAPRGGLPNSTVLLPNDRPHALSDMMPALIATLPPGLSLRLSGPWPAYAYAREALGQEAANA